MPPCTARTGAPGAATISMPWRWCGGAGAGLAAAEARPERTADRPRQVALERAQRQVGRTRAGQAADGGLQPRPGLFEFADVLRGQLAPPVEVVEQPGAFVHGAPGGGVEGGRFGAQPRHLALFGGELIARRLLVGEQLPVRGDAQLLDARQRHDAAAGPGQVAAIGGGQQQPRIARLAAALVERFEPALERRRAFHALPSRSRPGGVPTRRPWRRSPPRRVLTAASSSARRARVSSSWRSDESSVRDWAASWSDSRCRALMRSSARSARAAASAAVSGGASAPGAWAGSGMGKR